LKRISRELDDLMWLVAEGEDPQAIAEFEARYPDLRPALARRIAAVEALRAAGKSRRRSEGIPPFRPRRPQPVWMSPRVAAAVGGLALFALAGASYLVTSHVFGSQPASVVAHMAAPPETVLPEPAITAPPPATEVVPPADPAGVFAEAGDLEIAPGPPNRPLQEIRIDGAPLLTALEAVAELSGLRLEIAPGMPNGVVSVRSGGRTGLEVMQELGREHGFTAFYQGGNTVLLVPAVDGASAGDPAHAQRSVPNLDR
jgi:hypothetical protein